MNTRTLLFLAGAAIALSHLANEWVSLAPPGGLVWKAAGIVLLGLYALSQRAWLAGAALLFCAAGDVLLELVFVAGMGDLLIPALIYQAIITTMVATAFVVKAPMLARLGAVIFMISDTLIAAEKFAGVDVFPGAVWITYAGAQIMMAWGMSRVAPYRDRALREKAAAA